MYKDLKIKNIETERYIDLERIPYRTLREAGFSDVEVDKLVGQDKGYEINIFLSNEEDILKLAQEFIRKSSEYLVDEEGNIIFETSEELRQRDPWPGAHETPVIIIGGNLSRIKDSIPGFRDAYLFRFQDPTIGEYNFVIRKFIGLLTQTDQHLNLLDFGFKKENCLANIHFIRNYVDNL